MTEQDPYASLAALASGWRAQAVDLRDRADGLVTRSYMVESKPDRDRFDPEPGELRVAARSNRTTAAALDTVAAQLDDGITFARRHVLGADQ